MSKFYQDLAGDQYEVLAKAIYRKELGQLTDPMDLYLPLLALPRSLLSWLVQNVKPITIDESRNLNIPGSDCILDVRKLTYDLYSGQILRNNKIIHTFDPTSLPALGGHILNVCELYEEVAGRPVEETEKKELADKMSDKEELKSIIEKLGNLVDSIVQSQVKKDEFSSPEPKSQQPVVVNVTLSNIGNSASQKEEPKAEEIKKEEKGVHAPYIEPGRSEAGIKANIAQERPVTHWLEGKQAKELHQKKLKELKSMPKPNLPKSELTSGKISERLKKKREFLNKKDLQPDKGQKAAPVAPQARTPHNPPLKGAANSQTKLIGPKDTSAATPSQSRIPAVPKTPSVKAPPKPIQPKIPQAQAQMKQALNSITKEELESAKGDNGKPMFTKDEQGKNYVFNPSGVHTVMTKESISIKKNEDNTYNLMVNGKEWDKENLELLVQMIKLKSLIKNWGY